jgi:hypothetical protein
MTCPQPLTQLIGWITSINDFPDKLPLAFVTEYCKSSRIEQYKKTLKESPHYTPRRWISQNTLCFHGSKPRSLVLASKDWLCRQSPSFEISNSYTYTNHAQRCKVVHATISLHHSHQSPIKFHNPRFFTNSSILLHNIASTTRPDIWQCDSQWCPKLKGEVEESHSSHSRSSIGAVSVMVYLRSKCGGKENGDRVWELVSVSTFCESLKDLAKKRLIGHEYELEVENLFGLQSTYVLLHYIWCRDKM